MARVDNLTAFLTDIATAIKTKKGDNTAISAADFDTEIINLPSPGIYQNKQVNITTNGNYIIAPDDTYDAMEQVVLNVEVAGKEDLDNVLNAQDQKITELEKALENKAAGGKVKLNVFAQTTEPEEKDGIWLETDKTFDKVHFDNNVKRITVEGWDTINEYPTFSFNSNNYFHQHIMVGDYFYVFNRQDYSNLFYRCNWKTGAVETLTPPKSGIPSSSLYYTTTLVGTDIYYVTSNPRTLCKYDTLTDTHTDLVSLKTNHNYCDGTKICSVGTDVYIFGGSFEERKISKYDTLTKSLSLVRSDNPIYINNVDNNGCLAVSGDIIYLIGGKLSSEGTANKVYMYDTKNNVFTELADTPEKSYAKTKACVIDNYIYIAGLGSTTTLYKYNILTDTYEKKTNASSDISGNCSFGVENNRFIGFIPNGKVLVYALTYDAIYDYENNSVVIWDGFGKYKTQLTKSADNQEGKIQTLFYNAYHYTVENGLDDTIPTYYGDGTQWIKFKN